MVSTRIKFFAITLIWIFLLNLSILNIKADKISDSDQISDYDDNDVPSATFIDAWYADMEGDGFQDDIVFRIKIDDLDLDKSFKYNDDDAKEDDDHDDYDSKYKLESHKKQQTEDNYNKIYLKVELVLPSGYVFFHYIEKIVVEEEFVFILILYNHAIESGWYWGHITIVDNNYYPLSEKDSIYFDPPGVISGGTPRLE